MNTMQANITFNTVYIYISSLDMTMLIQISKIYATKWHEYANMC